MPTYEYECKSCHHRFERLQPITARSSASCPRCKKAARRRISSGAGLMFKGSGFYITDHRSSGYRKRAEADKTSSQKPASKKPDKS